MTSQSLFHSRITDILSYMDDYKCSIGGKFDKTLPRCFELKNSRMAQGYRRGTQISEESVKKY